MLNLPLSYLARRMAELPRGTPIIAYCRGPYCVMAVSTVHQLREVGFPAARLEVRYHGLPRPAEDRPRSQPYALLSTFPEAADPRGRNSPVCSANARL